MQRYIAIIWQENHSGQCSTALKLRGKVIQRFADWSISVDAPGMFVCRATPSRSEISNAYVLSASQGVVLGQLFERKYVERCEGAGAAAVRLEFDEATSWRVVNTSGDELKEKYWGTYVALLRNDLTRQKMVLRDPSGGLACQSMMLGEIHIYFSNIADILLAEPIPLRVNRHFIVGSLVSSGPFSGETAYEEVETILPGQRVVHTCEDSRADFFWNPLTISTDHEDISFTEGAALTRRTVESCVHAWASCFSGLALQLSGGLDSTIVAACLASAPTCPRVTCINFHIQRGTSDERSFAREVAERAGFELIERRSGGRKSLELNARQNRAVVPTLLQRYGEWDEVWRALRERGSMALLRGDGGDELFHKGVREMPDSVDHAFRHGLGGKLWSIAMNDALIERRTVWEVLALAAKHGILKQPFDWRRLYRLDPKLKYMTDEAREYALNDETIWHPLYRHGAQWSPGKLLHSHRFLKYTCKFYMPAAEKDELPTLAPLLAQPHMELSLRMPLSLMRFGGRDRALARAAFAADMPTSIAQRKFKGLSQMQTDDWISSNPQFVRELLLGGYLAQENIIDRYKLETLLAKNSTARASAISSLIVFISIEAWLRNAEVHGMLAA